MIHKFSNQKRAELEAVFCAIDVIRTVLEQARRRE